MYVKEDDFCVEFCPVIKRGATIKTIDEELSSFGRLLGTPHATIKTIDEELSRFGRLRGTPHAVLLHIGTHSLANYFYADGPVLLRAFHIL